MRMAKDQFQAVSFVKEFRQARGWSQDQLADRIGVRRQAIYDIESGRYLPNTAVALRLARQFRCRVEDLFKEEETPGDASIQMVHDHWTAHSRICVANIRGRLVGFALDGRRALADGLRAADGLLSADGRHVELFSSSSDIDQTALLMGCDPAFEILSAHVARQAAQARVLCRFASSSLALKKLAAGQTHIAGTHLHNTDSKGESNVSRAAELLAGTHGKVVGYSLLEEGLIVARGNPLGIHSVADLCGPHLRFVNRERGAALRMLLDDQLRQEGIAVADIHGYDRIAYTHIESAQIVAMGLADAGLGFRIIARAFDLDFVPMAVVRSDLVIPRDLLDHPTVQRVMETLQTAALKRELSALPGYDPSPLGHIIAEV
ncbi:MAG: substrate-binding domain-containing protein [Anaerolineaceae bacterium]|nr:substrate-binding domain-containing protein [Anaerolineaceae bacterium]